MGSAPIIMDSALALIDSATIFQRLIITVLKLSDNFQEFSTNKRSKELSTQQQLSNSVISL